MAMTLCDASIPSFQSIEYLGLAINCGKLLSFNKKVVFLLRL